MNIIEKPINEIRPYENNPRRNDHAVEAVANSIRDFGFRNPIIIDRDGVILAGHTRHKAAKVLGLETVPCIVADDLDEDAGRAFRIADNKTGEYSIWDREKLAEEIDDIGIDLEQYGFSEETINEIDLNNVLGDKNKKITTCPHCGEEIEI